MNFLKRTGIWIAGKILPIRNEGMTEWQRLQIEGKALREEIKELSENPQEPSDPDKS